MMIVRNFVVGDMEYMVVNGTAEYMPGAASIRLLAHRRLGVGADRVLVFTGTEEVPAFMAFRADGAVEKLTAEDYRVLSLSRPACEIHLTNYFVQCLREADEAAEFKAVAG